MRKILFCAYDRPEHQASGPNVWLKRLIPHLKSKGWDISLFIIYSGEKESCPTLSFFEREQISLTLISSQRYIYIEEQIQQLWREIRVNKYTTIVANLVVPALHMIEKLDQLGIQTMSVTHSNDDFYRFVIQEVLGVKSFKYHQVVAVSSFLRDKVQQQNKSVKVKKIPCGTNIVNLKAIYQPSLKVLYVGRIVEKQKQILLLTKAFIDAAEKIPALQFALIGDGDKAHEVEQLIASSSVSDRVQFLGAKKESEIHALMADYQAFTMMSDFEGLPVALMEAMSVGLVPVCLDEPCGIRELVEHGKTGLIAQNRFDDYVRQLEKLKDEDFWQELSNNAKNKIETFYSLDKTAVQWEQVFNSTQIGKVKYPKFVRFEPLKEIFPYGDARRPNLEKRVIKQMKSIITQIRLFVRPRARLRALINKTGK